MEQEDGQAGSSGESQTLPDRIVADPRKFSQYVLVPDHPSGKDRIFVGQLGYRPRNEDDAAELSVTYVEQARQRWVAGDAVFSRENEHGRFYVIVIELRGVRVRTVWNLRPNGELALVTPFRGFATPRE